MLKITSLGLALIAVVLTAPAARSGTIENQHQSTSKRVERKIQTKKLTPIKKSFSLGTTVTIGLLTTTERNKNTIKLENESKKESKNRLKAMQCQRAIEESQRRDGGKEYTDPNTVNLQNNNLNNLSNTCEASVGFQW